MIFFWAKILVLIHFVCLSKGETFYYPSANLSTSWTNSASLLDSVSYLGGSMIRPILLHGSSGPSFACGFFCNGNCNSYLFAIFVVQTSGPSLITMTSTDLPQVVWSANRNNPVTADGDLILKDADETIAWSTNTSGKSVAGLNLTNLGNLMLYDVNGIVVWQSFDHPTDSLVPGQKLLSGMKLTPSVSATNWTQLNLLSLSVTDQGMFASVESTPPQVYNELSISGRKTNKEPTYVILTNATFSLYANSSEPRDPDWVFPVDAPESSAKYARFFPDGHFRIYQWENEEWTAVAELLLSKGYECFYPTVCGTYGICSNGQCSCPSTTYFKHINDRQLDLGCYAITPLFCGDSQNHSFILLNDITYPSFQKDLENVDSETCKIACSNNCSCKAAIFQYRSDSTSGDCYMPNQVFSLTANTDKEKTFYNSTIYLKVQDSLKLADIPITTEVQGKKKSRATTILLSSLGSVSGLLLVVGFIGFLAWKKRNSVEDEEYHLDQAPGLPTRFSYDELKALTNDFSKVLGEGGFGVVFEGTLTNGTKIAVKRLDGLGHVKNSFLAEVESMGGIHHVNLVRLHGFCAHKSHRLLVYEFMSNGSLDKWIFHQSNEVLLDWKQRKKIILDISKGLAYLHEECAQKIIHLDIKPQNILLDHQLNAKISDFGLSKLMDRDQSKVVTTMRGTPGYLAPEWLSSMITEKADVYSFGVVVLEMLCGRRNVDRSQPEGQMYLLKLFEKKTKEDKLIDLIDSCSEDLQLHKEEVINMMKLAGWCLQKDYSKRPPMSMVVKVLEGVAEIENGLHCNVVDSSLTAPMSNEFSALVASVLSGPR